MNFSLGIKAITILKAGADIRKEYLSLYIYQFTKVVRQLRSQQV